NVAAPPRDRMAAAAASTASLSLAPAGAAMAGREPSSIAATARDQLVTRYRERLHLRITASSSAPPPGPLPHLQPIHRSAAKRISAASPPSFPGQAAPKRRKATNPLSGVTPQYHVSGSVHRLQAFAPSSIRRLRHAPGPKRRRTGIPRGDDRRTRMCRGIGFSRLASRASAGSTRPETHLDSAARHRRPPQYQG